MQTCILSSYILTPFPFTAFNGCSVLQTHVSLIYLYKYSVNNFLTKYHLFYISTSSSLAAQNKNKMYTKHRTFLSIIIQIKCLRFLFHVVDFKMIQIHHHHYSTQFNFLFYHKFYFSSFSCVLMIIVKKFDYNLLT